ncbi:MAG: 1-acyl-sn-glycerol-3-phosphate acyltransferase [Actinomycetota bacterium]
MIAKLAPAAQALEHAIGHLKAGHLIGIYPEGTLTRDADYWPMVAKTGAVRLAILTQNPIIPVVAWGPQKCCPPIASSHESFLAPKLHIEPVNPSIFHLGMEKKRIKLP